jgi:hypothetical protein
MTLVGYRLKLRPAQDGERLWHAAGGYVQVSACAGHIEARIVDGPRHATLFQPDSASRWQVMYRAMGWRVAIVAVWR